MRIDRRSWLKSAGMLCAGLCVPGVEAFATTPSAGDKTIEDGGLVILSSNENLTGRRHRHAQQ